MKTIIYYYSATGNSLVLSREIARELGDTQLIPIRTSTSKEPQLQADSVGLVFPIYAWGPPKTVSEFVSALDPKKFSYCFALATCGGTVAGTLPKINKMLRKKKGRLQAGFAVPSPGYLPVSPESKEFKMVSMIRKLSGKLPETNEKRLAAIISTIKERKNHKPERAAWRGSILGNMFHGIAVEQMSKFASLFSVAESCNGCGVCAKLCPRENIKIENKRPHWAMDCDGCRTCATWCPQKSILFDGKETDQAHNSQIELKDLLF